MFTIMLWVHDRRFADETSSCSRDDEIYRHRGESDGCHVPGGLQRIQPAPTGPTGKLVGWLPNGAVSVRICNQFEGLVSLLGTWHFRCILNVYRKVKFFIKCLFLQWTDCRYIRSIKTMIWYTYLTLKILCCVQVASGACFSVTKYFSFKSYFARWFLQSYGSALIRFSHLCRSTVDPYPYPIPSFTHVEKMRQNFFFNLIHSSAILHCLYHSVSVTGFKFFTVYLNFL